MKKVLGIYHSRDLDGLCCAAIMKYKYGEDVTLIGYDYGQPYDHLMAAAREHKRTIMADVSLENMEAMQKLHEQNKDLTWVDHHISAIDDYYKYAGINKDVFDASCGINKAACELLWYFFFHETHIPLIVFLLGKYDTWRQAPEVWIEEEWGWDDTLAYQMGMRLPERYNIDWITDQIQLHMNEHGRYTEEPIMDGAAILDYQQLDAERQCQEAAFEIKIGAYRAICLNTGQFNSNTFKSVWDESKYDIMVAFRREADHWRVGFYTTKENIDCSKIAKNFNGGGHKKAAGCQIPLDVGDIGVYLEDFFTFPF